MREKKKKNGIIHVGARACSRCCPHILLAAPTCLPGTTRGADRSAGDRGAPHVPDPLSASPTPGRARLGCSPCRCSLSSGISWRNTDRGSKKGSKAATSARRTDLLPPSICSSTTVIVAVFNQSINQSINYILPEVPCPRRGRRLRTGSKKKKKEKKIKPQLSAPSAPSAPSARLSGQENRLAFMRSPFVSVGI